jgi:hypothetical protein
VRGRCGRRMGRFVERSEEREKGQKDMTARVRNAAPPVNRMSHLLERSIDMRLHDQARSWLY